MGDAAALASTTCQSCAHSSPTLAEALALGQRGGLEWAQLWQVVLVSAAASPIVQAKALAFRAHD